MAILKGRCRVASVGAWNVDAFIHLSFLTGCSPDEIRGLYWDQVDDLDSEAPGFDVTRTLRHNGGTKTVGAVAGWACLTPPGPLPDRVETPDDGQRHGSAR